MGRAEIGAAQRLCDDHTFWQLGRGREGGAGDIGEAAPDHLEGDELDGLVGAGAGVRRSVDHDQIRRTNPIVDPLRRAPARQCAVSVREIIGDDTFGDPADNRRVEPAG